MTDWIPWGIVVTAGTFTTLALLLRTLGRTPMGARPDLRAARTVLIVTVVATVILFVVYLVAGEDWLRGWYFK